MPPCQLIQIGVVGAVGIVGGAAGSAVGGKAMAVAGSTAASDMFPCVGSFMRPGPSAHMRFSRWEDVQVGAFQQHALCMHPCRRAVDIDGRSIKQVGTQLQHFACDQHGQVAGLGGEL